jgi:PhnB protein
MTKLNPYINFPGNCREAMTFYKECFGGKLTMQTVGESPMAEQMPKETHHQVMHAQLIAGDIMIMAAEMMGPNAFVRGNNITLCINCTSEEEINNFFSKLSEGGNIMQPLAKQFWGALFGMVTDKFGISWMMNYENKKDTAS